VAICPRLALSPSLKPPPLFVEELDHTQRPVSCRPDGEDLPRPEARPLVQPVELERRAMRWSSRCHRPWAISDVAGSPVDAT